MIAFLRKSFSVGKKVSFILLILTFFALSIPLFFQPSKDLATLSNSADKDREDIYKLAFDPTLQKNKKLNAAVELQKMFACKTVGELCSPNPSERDQYFNKSALSDATNFISLPLTNPPASGVYWVYDSLQKSGFVPKTYAAEGIGFAGIKPFAKLWEIFRNITFLLLSLFLIIIGILIMIRFKINPQTVITLENSLPRIFITLIFITFSFPVAGFLIDMMYTVILLGIAMFHQADKTAFGHVMDMQLKYTSGSLGVIWDGLFPGKNFFSYMPILGGFVELANLGTALVDILPSVVNNVFRTIGSLFITLSLIRTLADNNNGILGNIAKILENIGFLTVDLGGSASNTVLLVFKVFLFVLMLPLFMIYGAGWILGGLIFFTIFFLFIRLFVLIFGAYIRILLLIIFAPFLILPTLLPGKNGFTKWVRMLAGELSVFPTIVFMLLTGRLLVNIFAGAGGINGPVIGGIGFKDQNVWHPPFLSSIGRKNLAILVGMALIMALPQIARYVKEKVSGSKGLPFKLGPSLFFGGVGAAVGGGFGAVSKLGGVAHAVSIIGGPDAIKSIKSGIGKGLGAIGLGGGKAAHSDSGPSTYVSSRRPGGPRGLGS